MAMTAEQARALAASGTTGIGVSSIGTGDYNGALRSPTSGGGYITSINDPYAKAAGVPFSVEDVTIKEMQHVVFNTPVQVLLDVWGQRYGDEWVNREEVLKDEFFSIAYKRLKKLGRIEVHYLIDRNEYVCRKVPDEHL